MKNIEFIRPDALEEELRNFTEKNEEAVGEDLENKQQEFYF